MIKINLVGEGRKVVAAKPKTRGLPTAAGAAGGIGLANIFLISIAIASILALAIWWFMLWRTINTQNEEITVAKQRVAELQEILDQVEEYKRKEIELEQKIDVITELKNNQLGPVRIMDEISKGLPDLLWLDRFDLANSEVSLAGRSFSWNAVANLAESLDQVELFQEPVGPTVTQSGEVFTWTLKFRFDPKAATTSETTDVDEGVEDDGDDFGEDDGDSFGDDDF